MDSAHAALGTYELLEAILLSLPPADITRSMRVCRTWHKIVLESSRLKGARVLRHLPSSKTEHNPTEVSNAWIPRYPATAGMRLNPIFGSDCDYFESGGLKMTRLLIYPANMSGLRSVHDEYATLPPCTTITLETYGLPRYCTVYNVSGIRIRELLDCTRMLCKSKDEENDLWLPRSRQRKEAAVGKIIGCSTAETDGKREKQSQGAGSDR